MYEVLEGIWSTPKGRRLRVAYRDGTSDWNTVSACLTHDEYGLASLPALEGLAIDIGSHVGSVALALAADFPTLHVVAVEPVPGNVDLLRRNVAANGLGDRITVIDAGAAAPDIDIIRVWYGATGDENAIHHAFIGNSSLVYDSPGTTGHQERAVRCTSISTILGPERRAAILKIDCEGCEWSVLTDPAVSRIARIVGEWHPTNGMTRADVMGLLGGSHDVAFSGPEAGPGGFVAVLS